MEFKYCDKCITVVSKSSNMGPTIAGMIDHPWIWHVICDRKIIASGSCVCSSIASEEAKKASVLYHGVKFKDENVK